ncbi:MAG: Ig-like domain-containing protein [Thermoplasmatota archaeon]
MKVSGLALIISTLLLLTMAVPAVDPQPTRAPRSGNYPVNREIQDYEPSAEEQWDLDVSSDEDGRYFAVWGDDRDEVHQIRFSKSLNGTSWGDGQMNNNDIIVSDGPGEDEKMYHPSVTAGGDGSLYCIWMDDRTGDFRVRMSTSRDSGNTWNNSKIITGITGMVSEPRIRWSQTAGLCIVYVEESMKDGGSRIQKDIMFTRSRDGGKTFSTPVQLNDDTTEEDQLNPRMTVSPSGAVGIIWEDLRNGDSMAGTGSGIYFTTSKDGLSFRKNVKVSAENPDVKRKYPDMAFSAGGDVAVVWQETSLNGWRVMYSLGWAGSPTWNGEMEEPVIAVNSNLSRLDQFIPRLDYVEGAFAIAWTELDVRNFYLIRAGYISRNGMKLTQDHIIDDSIDLGTFINDINIYHAEMYRETVAVIGYEGEAQIFWSDHRSDPNPSNDINEDADPYTAKARGPDDMPLKPKALGLQLVGKGWNQITLKWPVSPDIEFKGYYLTYGKGTADVPDEYINNAAITDRLDNQVTFSGLEPDTLYQFRMMVKDSIRNRNYSTPISIRTDPNQAPVFTFIEPDGEKDEADTLYTLSWISSDLEDTAYYTLYYDTDLDPAGQVFLHSGDTAVSGGEQVYYWNTTGLPDGGYTINATIDDGVNDPVIVYSRAIIINHPVVVKDLPRVQFVTVEGGMSNAFADASLNIVLSKPVATTTLSQENLYVLGPDNKRIQGTISLVRAEEVQWRPSTPLQFGSEYHLVLTARITDTSGNNLDGEGVGSPSNFDYYFKTRPDTGVPRVRQWVPQGNSVDIWPSIRVKFDLPMDSDTMTSESVILLEERTDREVKLEMTYFPQEMSLQIRNIRPLISNYSYTMNLSGIESEKGQDLPPFEWSFKAGQPSYDIDTDDDGVPDDLDWFPEDPTESVDTDDDGKGNNIDTDDDGDGMPDEWELKYGLDPLDPEDADWDLDGDGTSNLNEYRQGTPASEGEDEKINHSLVLFLSIFIAVLVIMGLIVFSLYQRRKMERERMESSFFREGEDEE